MRVPHQIVGRTRPTSQPLGYFQAAPVDFSPLVQGAVALGQGLDQLARRTEQRDAQTDRFQSLTNFSNFETRMAAELAELKRGYDPKGTGFAVAADKLYKEREAQFLATEVVPELRPEFKYRSSEIRGRVLGESLDFQYKQGDAYFRQGINTEYQKALVGLDPKTGGDPAQLEAWKGRVFETIDASDLSAAEKEDLKLKTSIGMESVGYKQAYKINVAKGAMKLDATIGRVIDEAADRYGVSREALRTVAWLESTGDPSAQNPVSSAGGLFQVIDSTAKQYGLKNKFDPAESADVGARIMRDNINILKRALGRDPSAGELYLAHQQGAQGAINLLTNPNSLATSIVGVKEVMQNGGAPGMTAQQFANLWIKKAEGANPDLDSNPAYANVPYEDRLAMQADADRELLAEETERVRQEKARIDTGINTLKHGIMDRTMGQADIDAAVQNGILRDADQRKSVQDMYDKSVKDDRTIAAFTAALSEPLMVFDPTSEKMKDAYNLWFGVDGKASLMRMDNNYVNSVLAPAVQRTSDIPTEAIGVLTGQVRSSNQQQALWAYDVLAQFQDLDGRAFDARVPESLAKDVAYYRARKDSVPADQLMEMINGGYTQEERNRRRTLREEAQTLLAKADKGRPALSAKIDEVVDSFGGLFSSAELVAIPAFARELNEDFQTAYIDAYEMFGDDDQATEAATKSVQRTWGVTAIGGKPTIMKYPPEKVGYKPLGGDYAWIDEQLRGELGLFADEQFQLISDEQTEKEYRSWQLGKGPPASYMVVVQSADGAYSLRMTPDGKPDRRYFEPTPADIKKEENDFIRKNIEGDLMRLDAQIEQAEKFRFTTGIPVPEELIQERDRLSRERDAATTPPAVYMGNEPLPEPSVGGAM